VNVSEPSENPASSSASSISESYNDSDQKDSEVEQEQMLPPIEDSIAYAAPIINPRAFVEMTGYLPHRQGPTGFVVERTGWYHVFLPYEKAREFIMGIDFSQLEPIGRTDEIIGSVGGMWYSQPSPEGKPMSIAFDSFFAGRALILIGIQNRAIYRIYEEPVVLESPISSTSYEYYMSDEFYDAVWERLEGFLQYAQPMGGALPPDPSDVLGEP